MQKYVGVVLVVFAAISMRCKGSGESTSMEGRNPGRRGQISGEASRAKHNTVADPEQLQTRRGARPRQCQNPFVPRWNIGQKWRVRYTYYYRVYPMGTQTVDFEYRVAGLKNVNGRSTYVVKLFLALTGVPIKMQTYLHVDADTFTLLAADGLWGCVTSNLGVSRPFMDTRVASSHNIEFDFGAFCSIDVNSSRQKSYAKARSRLRNKFGLKLSKDSIPTEVMTQAGNCHDTKKTAYIQEIDFAFIKGSMKVKLMEPITRGGRSGWLVSEQIWKKGQPWWTSAKRTSYNGNVVAEGKLIDW